MPCALYLGNMEKEKGGKDREVSRSPIISGRERGGNAVFRPCSFFTSGFGFFIPTHPARQRGAYIGIKLGYNNLPKKSDV